MSKLKNTQNPQQVLTFKNGKKVLINSEFYIPLPDGFHYSEDTNVIGDGRQIVIVPEGYALSADPMEAPIGFSLQVRATSLNKDFDPAIIEVYKEIFIQKFHIFNSISPIRCAAARNGFGVLYQTIFDSENDSWIKNLIVIFSGEYVYIAHLINNSEDATAFDAVWNFTELTDNWLGRLYLQHEFPYTFSRTYTPGSLYQHYLQILDAMVEDEDPTIKKVINASGTEYEFIPVKNFIENKPDVCQRVITADTASYCLDQEALRMAQLFRVDKNVFDRKHDRECEICSGYMHRAYMMSALRSFAWTLTAYCEETNITPSAVTYENAHKIVEYIAEREWLNYNGTSHCQGLCGCSDIHVFYIPDVVSDADRKEFLPTQEDYDRVSRMRASLPSYNEVLTETHSLDALRNDLAYIYPAIRILWDALQKTRNHAEALTGNEADIVYAWCALALAAREPFFSEDGPMTCWFEQKTDGATSPSSENELFSDPYSNSQKSKKPNDIIGVGSDKNISGCNLASEDDLDIFFGELKKYKGTDVRVTLPHCITKIGEGAFEYSDMESVVIPEGVTEIDSDAFYLCDCLKEVILPSTLIKIGRKAFYDCEKLQEIILPEGLQEIENDAFNGCKALRKVVVPNSCIFIGADAFTFCENLKDIYVPASVQEIEDDAFCTFNDDMVIHTSRGSVAAQLAKAKGWTVKFDLNPPANVTFPQNKAVTDGFSGVSVFEDELEVLGGTLKKYAGSETRLILPAVFTKIGELAFAYTDLEAIFIPEGVTEIGNSAFSNCDNLETVVLPSSLDCIGKDAFWNCGNLQNILLPEGLKEIGNDAFNTCSALTKIVIPHSCVSIGSDAFFDCSALKDIYVPASVQDIGDDAFYTFNKDMVIHTQRESIAAEFAEENGWTVKFDYD